MSGTRERHNNNDGSLEARGRDWAQSSRTTWTLRTTRRQDSKYHAERRGASSLTLMGNTREWSGRGRRRSKSGAERTKRLENRISETDLGEERGRQAKGPVAWSRLQLNGPISSKWHQRYQPGLQQHQQHIQRFKLESNRQTSVCRIPNPTVDSTAWSDEWLCVLDRL